MNKSSREGKGSTNVSGTAKMPSGWGFVVWPGLVGVGVAVAVPPSTMRTAPLTGQGTVASCYVHTATPFICQQFCD
jgi:hypothetical protein